MTTANRARIGDGGQHPAADSRGGFGSGSSNAGPTVGSGPDRHAELPGHRPQVGDQVVRVLVAAVRVLGHHPGEDGGQVVRDRPG